MIGPRAAVLAIALFCSFMLPGVVRAASVGDGDPELRITAQLWNLSIQEALEAVALLAGRPIEVIGPIEEREISVNLHEATLLESIDKVLSPSSYVVILSEDKSLVIRVLGGAGDRADAGHDPQAESRDDPVDGLVSIFRDGPEVIPPSQPGEEGLTMADIEYYWSFAPDLDPSEEPVFPPSSADEDVFTEQDLAILLTDPDPYPPDADLVPPDDEGHAVITLQDLETLRSAVLEQQPSEVSLWPADEAGDSSMPVTDLGKSLGPTARVDLGPESLADLIPPE